MNNEGNQYCYFHPKEAVIGICPLCLNERLLLLAANQSNSSKNSIHFLPKIFSFSSFLPRHWRSDLTVPKSDPSYSSSPDGESFISIKFEENGAALWEKGKNATVAKLSANLKETKQGKEDTRATMCVIEHAKPRGTLRWRKRIDHLFQVINKRRSSRANSHHVSSKPEGVKVMRKGWIRILSRRRAKE